MNVVVFWEEGFPFVDTTACTQKHLRDSVKDGDQIEFVDTEKLASALEDTTVVLVLPYGSAFPKSAWTALSDFLNRGGSWVNIGGSPLSRPVRRNKDGSWYVEVPQTGYSKEIGITQAFPVDLEAEGIWLNPEDREEGEPPPWYWADRLHTLPMEVSPPRMKRSWSLQVRFTDNKDYPGEGGSSGTRDAVIRSQGYALFEGRRIAAPMVVIDRVRGPFAGGTWALVNAELTDPLQAEILYSLLSIAALGPIELDIRPTHACYYPGEQPALLIRFKAHRREQNIVLVVRIGKDGEKDTIYGHGVHLISSSPNFRHVPLPALPELHYERPGLYRVHLTLDASGAFDSIVKETGFWIYDEALLTSSKPLTVNRDYFERDGEPYPVMGTTYMAGDVSRKFLFEPNCAVWDRDFAEMKAAGVNMVRTGLWTGWRRAMLDPGAVDEGVLRAFTAFLLTARKYDIPVIFNFFAFLPEAWGGSNPYFDPRAVEAQKELIAAFAHRFANVNDLMWDFINEPSFSSPARVWSTKPNYDRYERAAWSKWLEERAKDFSEEEKQAANPADVWRERWRLTPNAPLDLPTPEDFQDKHIFQGTHPLRALDYRLFAQESFNRWVVELSKAIRSNGNPQQLITVGQDEGGIWERPNPHFYADVVDVTTNHSWWQNDDLLWDSVMTKTPNKPNLIQETGIMFVENMDGGFRRSPEECAHLLAKKLILSFAAGCAGAIQWLWNTNFYMDDDNEVGIGFFRADGTEKPELQVFRELAEFFWSNRHHMVARKLEEVAIVIPHSSMFGVRGDIANQVTRRAIKTLEYDLGVPTRTVSEYRVYDIGEPKLIILPSPQILNQQCWDTLMAKVEAGAHLLVTGPIDRDEYWRPIPRINALDSGLETTIAPVTQHDEFYEEPGLWHPFYFRGPGIEKIDKAIVSGERIEKSEETIPGDEPYLGIPISPEKELRWRLIPIPHGKGMVHFFRFPAEVSQGEPETLRRLYRAALNQAGVEFDTEHYSYRHGFYTRRVDFAQSTLFLAIGETELGGNANVQYKGHRYGMMVYDGNDASATFVNPETGETLSAYPDDLIRKRGEEFREDTEA